jgi:hypothetical protein
MNIIIYALPPPPDFFTNPLETYVYQDPSTGKGAASTLSRRMGALHSGVLVSCTKNQACALLTFSAKRVNDPTRAIWGERKFASVLVEKKRGGLDWRFYLGFGHQFCFDAADKNSYFCMGYTYISEVSREKNIIVFKVAGKKGEVIAFCIPQMLPASHIPRIVSTITSAEANVSKQFFAAVKRMFNSGFSLPKPQGPFEKAKVWFFLVHIYCTKFLNR